MNPFKSISTRVIFFASLIFVFTCPPASAQEKEKFDVKANYEKREIRISVRDGVKLFTSVYLPKDTSRQYPIMFSRTPYTVAPYGEDKYKGLLGPSEHFMREGYIYQARESDFQKATQRIYRAGRLASHLKLTVLP